MDVNAPASSIFPIFFLLPAFCVMCFFFGSVFAAVPYAVNGIIMFAEDILKIAFL